VAAAAVVAMSAGVSTSSTGAATGPIKVPCGTVLAPPGGTATRTLKVTRTRNGRPDGGTVTCKRARKIIRDYLWKGVEPKGWVCAKRPPRSFCVVGNRIGWLVEARPRS